LVVTGGGGTVDALVLVVARWVVVAGVVEVVAGRDSAELVVGGCDTAGRVEVVTLGRVKLGTVVSARPGVAEPPCTRRSARAAPAVASAASPRPAKAAPLKRRVGLECGTGVSGTVVPEVGVASARRSASPSAGRCAGSFDRAAAARAARPAGA
jgi:hypothetical protein